MATYTVRDLCEHYSVTEHTVLEWIRNGELRAINVGRAPGKSKPRWRVTQESLDAFEALRSATPDPRKPCQQQSQPDKIIKFYE